jgi:surface protein
MKMSIIAASRLRGNPFVIVVDTSKAGSASDSFQFTGALGDYDVVAKQSGVAVETFSNLSGQQTITFSNGTGIYTLEVTPKATNGFNRIEFNNSGDRLKITDVTSWGNIAWSSFADAFINCSNINITATNAPNLSNLTDLDFMFRDCTSLTGLNVSNWNLSTVTTVRAMFYGCSSLTTLEVSNWDISNVTRMDFMFRDCTLLTSLNVTNWNVSNVLNMSNIFRNCDNFNQSLSNWNINNVSIFTSFMLSATGLSTANYDATLIGWEATLQAEYPNGSGYTETISIDFGGSQFTSGGAAETARTSLINNFSWTIADGGAV